MSDDFYDAPIAREQTLEELWEELEADTTTCNGRSIGELCGGCGMCLRMQFDHIYPDRPQRKEGGAS